MGKHEVLIAKDSCIGCGACVRDCVAHCLALQNGKAAQQQSARCIACGHCVAVCPKGAVSLSGFSEAPVEKTADVRLDPAAVMDVLRFRRSMRQFKDTPIPRDVLEQILEAGRITHTGANKQDVCITVLEEKKDEAEAMAVKLFRTGVKAGGKVIGQLRDFTVGDNFFFFGAPTVLVVASSSQTNGVLAAASMELMAEANGLGVLYSGFFTTCANRLPGLRKLLCIPKGKQVATVLVLGYPAVTYRRSAPREQGQVNYL